MNKPMFQKFKELTDAKGVSMNQVGISTGIASSTFSDWKSGRSFPKREKIEKIANYFDVPVDFFYETETSESKPLPLHITELIRAAEGCPVEDVNLAAAQLRRLKRYYELLSEKGNADV